MVKPVPSKRKLFNNCKDQFKENEPDQIIAREGDSFDSKTQSITSSPFSSNKSLNSNSKRGLAESSRCEGKKDKEGLNYLDWHKRCDTEDGGTIFSGGRPAMPMSERQQIALLMQLSSPSPNNKSDRSALNSPQTPTTPHYGRGTIKRNERGETPLHVAAIKGDCEKVSQLISQGANVNATDYAGWTALHEACNRGFYGIASLLINGGADINAKGLDNDTPLHDACVNNHYQIVKLLLKSGAKTNAVNIRGKTPLDVCRSPGILLLLEKADSGDLDFDSPEKDLHRVKLHELELENIEREERENTLSNNSSHTYSPIFEMSSRKTPPTNKSDDKPPIPSSQSSVSSSTGGTGSQGGNGGAGGGNGRPGSPRVTLRLPHMPRTPDKSQQRSHETKSSESEDVYEFRCTKEESKDGEPEEKTGDSGTTGGVKSQESSLDVKGDKRPRENEPDDEEEVKKKRRKDEGKEAVKPIGIRTVGGGRITSSSDKTLKMTQRTSSSNGGSGSKQLLTSTNNCSTSSAGSTSSVSSLSTSNLSSISSTVNTEQRRSPSAVSSPKPSKGSPEKADSDNEDTKSESTSGAPKVPPLKIVLAPCSLSEQETSSVNGKNGGSRQLPYVVNSSSGTSEDKEPTSSDSKEMISVNIKDVSTGNVRSGVSASSTKKTEALLIGDSQEEPGTGINSNNNNNNGNNNIGASISTSGAISSTSTASINTTTSTTVPSMNISSNSSGNGSSNITSTNTSSDKGSATRITRSQRGGGSGGSGSGSGSNSNEEVTVKSEVKSEEQMTPSDVVHPRKRKLKMKEPEMENPLPVTAPEQPVTNCYEMFLKIRKQVEKRRKLLFPVQPKPPQGFKDYLMNRCSYVLANSSTSQVSVPVIPAPASLSQPLKDLFNEQEQERYKLRLQQLIEKEKLVLSVEQEILRVHGRAARALANQVVPFSVCTILKDEEVYNVISPEQEEKDRNARSRYNGRLFLSWLQDVDDKWEKIKEAMVLRHHNEAESLHAVQKMDWEWKLKEIGLIEPTVKTQIDEMHVPMVQVADFDLLPA